MLPDSTVNNKHGESMELANVGYLKILVDRDVTIHKTIHISQ